MIPISKLSPLRPVRLLLLAPSLLFLSGCVVEESTRRSRPVYVQSAPPSAVEIIEIAPPPPQQEVIVVQPSPAHMWIHGYWAWQGGRHVWRDGHWELPPRAGSVWEEPRWEHREHGYVFVAGSWRNGPVVVHEKVRAQPAVSVGVNLNLRFVAQPPPPPRREVIVERERPSSAHVWINGYWVWRENRHVWIAGRWQRPPHAHAVWVEPRWEHRPEGHLFIEGYWR